MSSNCGNCPLRNYAVRKPNSIIARIWRWHTRWEWQGSYADGDARILNPSYEWSHSLGDVINSLIKAGLRIEYVHEFPMICWQALPSMEEKKPGWWGLKGDNIPLSFSLKAIKAA